MGGPAGGRGDAPDLRARLADTGAPPLRRRARVERRGPARPRRALPVARDPRVFSLARALGVHPFVAEKTTQQAAHFSIETLEQIYRRLLKVDEEVKTGQITLDLAMDTLVVELAGR